MRVETSREDKVLFPESRITKGDVIEYYRRAAPLVLRHARDRPLSFRRCPDGIDDCFFQKDRPDHFPSEISSVPVRTESETIHQVIVKTTDDLVYLANQACIEFHVPLARAQAPDKPDMVVFDLDPPPEGDFALVRRAARAVRSHLAELDLTCLLKSTGSRGLHVVVPIRPEHDFDRIRDWARSQAAALASAHSDWLTTEVRKAKRKGRLFLDMARNAYGQTVILPYSLRALEHAPVATPIDWEESGKLQSAGDYAISNLFRRLGQREDPWKNFSRWRQKLDLED